MNPGGGAPKATLELSLLGVPRIMAAGDMVAFETRKAVAILARAALEGPQRRDTLAAMLWPESDTVRARGALRRTLSALRAGLGAAVLVTDRDTVALEPGSFTSDVVAFRELVSQARGHHDRAADVCDDCLACLDDAAGLHRGEFLAGFGLRDSPGFDDWQSFEADAMRTEHAAALDLLTAALVHRGEMEPALRWARRRLALDPLHEPTHRRIMLLHAWSGRRQDAIQQYRACVSVLDAELGVPPLSDTTSLYEAILSGEPPPPPVAAASTGATGAHGWTGREARLALPLSGDGPPLVGREDALHELQLAWQSAGSDGALVLVEGEAGIGRSRVLEEFARRVQASGGTAVVARAYPGEDTLAYGPIADALRMTLTGPVPSSLSPAWLSEVARLVPDLLDGHPAVAAPSPLGTREADRRFFEGVRRALTSTGTGAAAALVVVEDLQWADTASRDLLSYVAHRLRGTPLCLVLAWRTEQVGRDDSLRRLVRDQRDATHIVLHRLGRDEVAAMAAGANLDAVGMDRATVVDRLWTETEGLPLFVTAYLDVLASLEGGAAAWPVPVGVRDLLAQRMADLTDATRQVLTAAAVIGRSVDLDTLLRASGRSDEETVAAIDELLAAGFVTEEHSAGQVSYRLRHHVLRSVVYDDTSVARRRLLHGRAAEALQRQWRPGRPRVPQPVVAEHLRLAGREQEAAMAFARAGDESRSLAAHADAVNHYRSALALGHPEPAALHQMVGDILTLLGSYTAAMNAYQAAAAASVDDARLARLEERIAGVHERRGDWGAAVAHLDAALAILPAHAAAAERARLEGRLSLAEHRRGRTASARERANVSLALAVSSDDALAMAQAHNILGILDRSAGEVESAVEQLEHSLALSSDVSDPAARVAALNNLALARGDAGDLPAALELAKTALARCRTLGDRHREAAILNNLADLLRAAGQDEEAMAHLKQAVAIFAEIGEDASREPEIWKLVEW